MSESVSVVDKIIAGLVEWPADSRRLDPAGVSAAAKALHMWEHGDPTDYADPDYRECVEVAVSAYLAVAGSPADEHPGYQLLRVADEVLDKLEREGSEPVHILGVQRHDDGTIDLVCGTVAPAAIFPPGRLDAPLKADAWDEGFAAGWDNGRAAENARIVAALRAKGTHAADVLADQIEREAP